MLDIQKEVEGIAQAAAQVDPNSVAAQVVEAAVETAANPANPLQIVKDLELAVQLVSEFKSKLSGLHPSIVNIIKALF